MSRKFSSIFILRAGPGQCPDIVLLLVFIVGVEAQAVSRQLSKGPGQHLDTAFFVVFSVVVVAPTVSRQLSIISAPSEDPGQYPSIVLCVVFSVGWWLKQ